MTREEIRAHAEALVADWPPPTPEQIETLRALLRPAHRAA